MVTIDLSQTEITDANAQIRDYAAVSVALDPQIENGGGHRVLGRLHTEAPKIPFITAVCCRFHSLPCI